MGEWLSGLAGGNAASALLWTVAALILLVIILIIVRLVRSYSSGTFIAGGRNRVPRLAVVDAIAVDSQRRLVLVRRDDAEHLLLIGGSNDVVVEPQIRARSPESDMAQPRLRQTAPAPAPALSPAPQHRPAAARPSAPAPRSIPPQRPVRAAPPVPQEPVSSARVEPEMTEAPPAPGREPHMPKAEADLWAAQKARQEPVMPSPAKEESPAVEPEQPEEFRIAADEPDRVARNEEAPSRDPELSIEDEMSRLLDDLTEDREKKG